jgi:hypothetical protein
MYCRTAWSIVGFAGAALLLFGLGTLWAQRPPEPARVVPQPPFMPGPMMGGPMHGRFTLAHASDKHIVVLDTATGKLYEAKPKDLLPYSELPKVGEPGRSPRGDGPDGRRRREEEERERKDREQLKRLDDARLRPDGK